MIVTEIVVLLILCLAFIYLGVTHGFKSERKRDLRETAMRRAQEALQTSNHNKIDEVLALWSDHLSKETKAYLVQRRDELYLEKNP